MDARVSWTDIKPTIDQTVLAIEGAKLKAKLPL